MDALAQLFIKPETLNPELEPYLCQGPLGLMLHHPLLIELTVDPAHCAFINKRFETFKGHADQLWKEGKYNNYVFRHERPYRIDAFKRCIMHLKPEEYWSLVGDIWIDSENIWESKSLWNRLWNSRMPKKEFAMSDEDREYLSGLEDTLTVYRGSHRASNRKGLSWTLDKEKGIWFAKRWANNRRVPHLLTATVHKKNVHAFMSVRGESEIVASNVTVLKDDKL